ncbi:hypothetical protein ACU4GD_20915 [Cupriavidus basilensis]
MTRTGLEDSAAALDMKDMTAGKPPCVALLSSVLDMSYLVPAFRAAAPGLDLRMGPATWVRSTRSMPRSAGCPRPGCWPPCRSCAWCSRWAQASTICAATRTCRPGQPCAASWIPRWPAA